MFLSCVLCKKFHYKNGRKNSLKFPKMNSRNSIKKKIPIITYIHIQQISTRKNLYFNYYISNKYSSSSKFKAEKYAFSKMFSTKI